MITLICILAGASLFFAAKYLFLRYETRRLHDQIKRMRENAVYGMRLYLEENDTAIAKVILAINQMVDGYEHKLRHVGAMERNIRHAISCISHDMRTPLTSLIGYLQLLSKEISTDKQSAYLDVIFNSAGMLRDLTDNFYELSQLDSDENTLSIQRVNLEHIVEECFLSFYENFSSKDIKITFKDAEKPPMVLADIVALKRVLYNVIQNVLRYAREAVSVTFSENNGCFSVTIGNKITTPIEINRIFERFYTGDGSRNNSGMGLGLYISKKLVERMNGAMTAYQDDTKLYITMALPTDEKHL